MTPGYSSHHIQKFLSKINTCPSGPKPLKKHGKSSWKCLSILGGSHSRVQNGLRVKKKKKLIGHFSLRSETQIIVDKSPCDTYLINILPLKFESAAILLKTRDHSPSPPTCSVAKLKGIISTWRQYLNRNDNLMYTLWQIACFISMKFFMYFILKRVNKNDDTVLLSEHILNMERNNKWLYCNYLI